MWGQEQIWLIALGGFLSFGGNVLYMMGGTAGFGKWYRRFIGAFVIASSTNIIAAVNGVWAWQYILIFPSLIGGFSLGYGANTTGEKIIKRSLFALGCIFAGIFGLWATGFTGFGW